MTSRSPNTERSSWLAHEAYVAAFRREAALLARALRGAGPDAPVPTCPGWTTDDLLRHVIRVYAHKAAVLRAGDAVPGDEHEPAAELSFEQLLDAHVAAGADLADRLGRLRPDDPAWTWMEGAGESTIGAWARRMAHEALVHRVDAELTAGSGVSATDDALAVDGIDEALTWMAGDPDVVASEAAGAGSAGTLLVDFGTGAWLVDLGDGVQLVTPAEPATQADARLAGEPLALDLALWGRPADVEWSGDPGVADRLRARLAEATA
jgi:uncharacterized protein (TIGR03083 family)